MAQLSTETRYVLGVMDRAFVGIRDADSLGTAARVADLFHSMRNKIVGGRSSKKVVLKIRYEADSLEAWPLFGIWFRMLPKRMFNFPNEWKRLSVVFENAETVERAP